MYSILSNNGYNQLKKIYLLDQIADLDTISLNSCQVGDQAFIIHDSSWYLLDHSKTWKNILINSSSTLKIPKWKGGKY